MENSREFHLSARKQKTDKTRNAAIVFIGTLIWIPACCLVLYEVNSGWAIFIFTVGFVIVAIGLTQYIEVIGRKWKLVINEIGISESGHSDNKDDWQVSWEEIRGIFYPPYPQKHKHLIVIFPSDPRYSGHPYIIRQEMVFYTSSDDSLTPADTHNIYDYDDLDEIYSYIKDLHQKFGERQNEAFAKQVQIRLEEFEKKEFIRQQQEREYFQRIKGLEDIQKIDPIQFEKLISALFKKMGYDVLLTKASRDEGIDLILSKNGKKSVVQCKRYSGTVGQPIARDLYGSMVHNRAEDAYLITTGIFSLPAQTWASGKPIHLVDGKMLVEWIETILMK